MNGVAHGALREGLKRASSHSAPRCTVTLHTRWHTAHRRMKSADQRWARAQKPLLPLPTAYHTPVAGTQPA